MTEHSKIHHTVLWMNEEVQIGAVVDSHLDELAVLRTTRTGNGRPEYIAIAIVAMGPGVKAVGLRFDTSDLSQDDEEAFLDRDTAIAMAISLPLPLGKRLPEGYDIGACGRELPELVRRDVCVHFEIEDAEGVQSPLPPYLSVDFSCIGFRTPFGFEITGEDNLSKLETLLQDITEFNGPVRGVSASSVSVPMAQLQATLSSADAAARREGAKISKTFLESVPDMQDHVLSPAFLATFASIAGIGLSPGYKESAISWIVNKNEEADDPTDAAKVYKELATLFEAHRRNTSFADLTEAMFPSAPTGFLNTLSPSRNVYKDRVVKVVEMLCDGRVAFDPHPMVRSNADEGIDNRPDDLPGGPLIRLLRQEKAAGRIELYAAFIAYSLDEHVLEAALSLKPVQTLLEKIQQRLLARTDGLPHDSSAWYIMVAKPLTYLRNAMGRVIHPDAGPARETILYLGESKDVVKRNHDEFLTIRRNTLKALEALLEGESVKKAAQYFSDRITTQDSRDVRFRLLGQLVEGSSSYPEAACRKLGEICLFASFQMYAHPAFLQQTACMRETGVTELAAVSECGFKITDPTTGFECITANRTSATIPSYSARIASRGDEDEDTFKDNLRELSFESIPTLEFLHPNWQMLLTEGYVRPRFSQGGTADVRPRLVLSPLSSLAPATGDSRYDYGTLYISLDLGDPDGGKQSGFKILVDREAAVQDRFFVDADLRKDTHDLLARVSVDPRDKIKTVRMRFPKYEPDGKESTALELSITQDIYRKLGQSLAGAQAFAVRVKIEANDDAGPDTALHFCAFSSTSSVLIRDALSDLGYRLPLFDANLRVRISVYKDLPDGTQSGPIYLVARNLERAEPPHGANVSYCTANPQTIIVKIIEYALKNLHLNNLVLLSKTQQELVDNIHNIGIRLRWTTFAGTQSRERRVTWRQLRHGARQEFSGHGPLDSWIGFLLAVAQIFKLDGDQAEHE